MKCLQCKTEIERPLVLYDGTMLCPKCKKNLTESKDFSDKNKEIFELSEVAYLRALISSGVEYKRLIRNAIQYCTEAAVGGYPHAVVQMGILYEKGLMDETLSTHERWGIAYNFYKSVCDSDDVDIPQQVKLWSASCLLDMLRTADTTFSMINKQYDYETNKNELLARFPGLALKTEERPKGGAKNQLDHIVALLNSGDSEKAPIFGFSRVNKDGIAMIASNGAIKRKNYEIYFLPCDAKGKVQYGGAGLEAITLDFRNVEQTLENIKNEKEGYLYFFKTRPKGRYNTNKLKAELKEGDFSRVIALIEAAQSQALSFRTDDLKYFSAGKETINEIIKHMRR